MRGLALRLLAMTMLMGMWVVLSGAEGSCLGTEENDCAQLDEQGCLSDGACKPVYGYPEDWYLYRGFEDCGGGLRCIVEPDVFIECLSKDADPCAGLEEMECLQRPNDCRPEYIQCLSGECPGYQSCSPIGPECVVDSDCRGGVPPDDCYEPNYTCEAGTCQLNCKTHRGCLDDSQCNEGRRCEISCSDTRCEGVCVAEEKMHCETTADCPEGFYCEHYRCPGCSVCEPGTWMSYDPIQCVSTYWEADFEYQPELYQDCMTYCQNSYCGEGTMERCMLDTFLANMGVAAYDIRRVVWEEDVCQACETCPRGYTLYALVAPYDEADMLHFGFKIF
jgi:hypothetical protein